MFHGLSFFVLAQSAGLGFVWERKSPTAGQCELPGRKAQIILKKNLRAGKWADLEKGIFHRGAFVPT
jgi:hypothetical protein